MVILTQDRCTVSAELTIGSDIVLDAPDGTPRSHGSRGISFGPFGDGVVLVQERCTFCAEHTIGSEIVLDAPDGTPR